MKFCMINTYEIIIPKRWSKLKKKLHMKKVMTSILIHKDTENRYKDKKINLRGLSKINLKRIKYFKRISSFFCSSNFRSLIILAYRKCFSTEFQCIFNLDQSLV